MYIHTYSIAYIPKLGCHREDNSRCTLSLHTSPRFTTLQGMQLMTF